MSTRSIKLASLVTVVVFILGALLGCAGQQASAPKSSSDKPATAQPVVAEKPAASEKPAPAKQLNYPTKEITWVVPTSPGGGYDTISRAIAPLMQKNLPNNPNIVVKNVAGGEWTIGVSEVYNAKPDGYTVGIFSIPGNAVNQVLGLAKYDLNKITWLGTITSDPHIAAVSPKSNYRTLDDLRKAPEVKIATAGLSSTSGLGALVASQRMGIKPKFVNHNGSSEAFLATIRGDADYTQFPYGSMSKYIVQSNELIPVWLYDKTRVSTLPNVPTIVELGYPDLLDIVASHFAVGTAPNTPPEISQILTEAFTKSVNDPAFVSKLKELGYVGKPSTGEETAVIVKNGVEATAKYKSELEKVIK